MRGKYEQGLRGSGGNAVGIATENHVAKIESGAAKGIPAFRTERFSNYDELQTRCSPQFAERWQLDEAIANRLREDWPGYCPLCDEFVDFRIGIANGQSVNLREAMVCGNCGTNARSRAGLLIAMQQGMTTDSRIYATEQASPMYAWLQSNYRNAIGSEFAEDKASRKRLSAFLHALGGHGEVRFEDVTKLSFEDGELDLVISYDVLEHVPDYRKAISEFARVLAPGGRLVLTAPFIANSPDTLVRARLRDDGTVEHLLDPEYYGDPLGEGVLCWYHFGWDLLDDARRLGFAEAEMQVPWAPAYGVFCGLWTLVARR